MRGMIRRRYRGADQVAGAGDPGGAELSPQQTEEGDPWALWDTQGGRPPTPQSCINEGAGPTLPPKAQCAIQTHGRA
jgi:hypothetical protein